jgi:predicted nuclease of predicted toxin-antitoxin system
VADPIRFYFDQHIHSAVAIGLQNRDIDVLTAQDAGRCGLDDSDQLHFATTEDRVVATFDRDYLALAATGVQHSGIAWCEATKYSIGQLIQSLLLVRGVLNRDDMRNHVEYLS